MDGEGMLGSTLADLSRSLCDQAIGLSEVVSLKWRLSKQLKLRGRELGED